MEASSRLAALFPTAGRIPAEARVAPVEQREYLLDGELRVWSGPVVDVVSPVGVRSGEDFAPVRLGSYPALDEATALAALDAAARAYDSGRGAWPTMAVAERIARVEEFLRRMIAAREAVVRLLMWEIGKTLDEAGNEFDRTIEYVRNTIDALKDLDRVGSRFVIERGVIAQIRRAPLGVTLCMGPFNYPLNETFTTLIPALLMGNPVVFKPPKLGVLLHQPLLAAYRDCFPRGVVNTVYGEGPVVVPPLMASGRVDVLAFIGTSRVADLLKRQHPSPHRLRAALGLDAKNPAVVLADADLDNAVSECVAGSLAFNGQRCTALKILFVQRGIADEFLARFTAAVAGLKCGMPWEQATLTPLPEPGKPERLAQLVADARRGGAQVVNADGGQSAHTFFYPAVTYPISAGMRLWNEEQFGPIAPIAPFDDVEEPVRYIIGSKYGQQVSLFGADPATMARLIDPLVNQVGRVNLNSRCQRGPDVFPFTGRKDSAEGTLSVSDALRVFSIRTLVAAKATDANKALLSTIVRDRASKFLSTDFIF